MRTENKMKIICVIVAIVFGVGILITVISTVFATWRFLASSVDDLYYS